MTILCYEYCFRIVYFNVSKNVKIGIKCSTAIPDSPQQPNNAIGFQWHRRLKKIVV